MNKLNTTHETKAGIKAEVFQYDPYYYPAWFGQMILTNKARKFLDDKRPDGQKQRVEFENKRGIYTAFLGDYIVRDEFGHMHVVSEKTFTHRFKRV